MKNFMITPLGIEVNQDNWQQRAKEIDHQYGICPALNEVVTAIAFATNDCKTKKAFDKAFNEAVKMIGYTPSYYHDKMKEIFTPDFED